MVRRFIAAVCLLLVMLVVASCVRSMISPDTLTFRLNDSWVVTMRHAQGNLTVTSTDTNATTALPHWMMFAGLMVALTPLWYIGYRQRNLVVVGKKK